MLVHRKNDDQSGGNKTVTGDAAPEGDAAKPRLVSEAPASNPASTDDSDESEPASGEDGKTHMIGDALKSVYQRTLEEEIPDDFLDLLKQLK